MTNAMIILGERVRLMDEGIIGTTGRTMVVEDGDGNKKTIFEPEEIHSYARWKEIGYQVTKGQKAVAKFPVWKHTVRKPKEDEEEGRERMFMRETSFFSRSQVEPVQAGA